MGRTLRSRRAKRKYSSFQSELQDAIVLDRLLVWMRSKNWSPTCSLTCYYFPETGRGLKALEKVKQNEIIVKIPKHLLITTNTISQSSIQHILSNPKVSDAQSVLAAFLVYEMHLAGESEWKPYLDSLPKTFTNPYFCTNREKKQLPNFVLETLNLQAAEIKSTYLALIAAIRDVRTQCNDNGLLSGNMEKCRHCYVNYENILTFPKYQWAYFVVNTRAVYIDFEEAHSRFRNNNLALAPFLDLFNHSFDASVNTGLTKNQNQAECYQITTLKSFDHDSQVFINYGSHDNTKLYVEYGFFILDNPLDEIIFNISDIDSCINLSEVQNNFLITYGFDKKMGFNSTGLNYNGKMALFIAVTKFGWKDWLMKIFGGDLHDDELAEIYLIGKKILIQKKEGLLNHLSEMKKFQETSASFKIALGLVEAQIRVLEYSLQKLIIN